MRATSSPFATESVTPFRTLVAPRESLSPSIARTERRAHDDAAFQRPSSRRARRASGSDIAR